MAITLFASAPEIVTPIGLAIDSRDRIYILESHTHLPSSDYPGPRTDLIKVLEDRNLDGHPEQIREFARDIDAGMNLAFSRNGELYVCTAREVLAFKDTDVDGVADERRQILRVESANRYPHNCQMGIAFSEDGWMYVSRGNTGSFAYTVYGSDGSTVSGFGDGGSVYRSRPDGSELTEIATGFWNAMDLKFDPHGHLMLVDNDPDARGPNRLIHVILHGDYGHRSVFGGSGNHPFQGWDGSSPGTLGYVAGTGEAPTGLIAANRTSLPLDYRNDFLVAIWNENTITRYKVQSAGSSLSADSSLWIEGDQDFRPVALEADSQGNLYITDWVLVDYPNHGEGAVWRISTRSNEKTLTPKGYFDQGPPDPGSQSIRQLMQTEAPEDLNRITNALRGEDPNLRHAAIVALSGRPFNEQREQLRMDPDPFLRMGALLALRRSGLKDPDEILKRFLSDPDEGIRRAALIWIGEEGLLTLKSSIDSALRFEDISSILFETYLATQEILNPAFIKAFQSRKGKANAIPRKLDPSILISILKDETRSDEVRALALSNLRLTDSEDNLNFLIRIASAGSIILRREALHSLSQASERDHSELFLKLALDREQPTPVRAEALLAINRTVIDNPLIMIPLLHDPNRSIRIEAARALKTYSWKEDIQKEFIRILRTASDLDPVLVEEAEFALFPPGTEAERKAPRPENIEAWHQALRDGGEPDRGERVFFGLRTQCSTCHQIRNRGRRIGPELSNVGQSLSRRQIIDAIIQPNLQFPPQYQAWFVELKNGDFYQGLQLDHKAQGSIEMYTTEGRTRHFKGSEIEAYGTLPDSLMPSGLENAMTVSEMRDLVAYLASRK